ncbi:tetratricopeptide repeat protein [Prochlorococcus sp. MIT 1223]|uniref:tetratricopeptide repeat protein n=1 Tax=Prochlorococcus sp. MIT 1223 TaxID=3096217 RepID=UPI002A763D3C|nr:tetratricopeptide repeat protein [Prochlorococcus sp. MIT 1223]
MKIKDYVKQIFYSFNLFLCLGFCLQIFLPLPALSATNLQNLFNTALLKSQEGNCLSAIEDWDNFLELSPDEPAAISNRGNCLLVLGDPVGAIEAHTKALTILPQNQDAHLNRGIAEEALHQWDLAVNDYEWILERHPKDSSALYNLGNVKGSQDNWEEAENLFNQAFLARSGFAMAQSSKALAQYQLGKINEAETELRLLIRKYPMFADARAALSALLAKQGHLGEAESHWAAANGLDVRYKDRDWLLNIRRWPSVPIDDLMYFLNLDN